MSGCATTRNTEVSDAGFGPMRGVLLDAGHGGEPEEAAKQAREVFAGLSKSAKQGYREECYGAISASGYKEKTATLAVTQKMKSLLDAAGISTAMTRSGDVYTSLGKRVEQAILPQYRDWVMVSIHFNRSSQKQQATNLRAKYEAPNGFEIYVLPPRGKFSTMGRRAAPGYLTVNNTPTANHALAESISARLKAISGMKDRGIKQAWFLVLRGSPMPGVLIEAGFLSNREEGQLIATEEYQWKLARAIVAGIQDYRNRSRKFATDGSARISHHQNQSMPISESATAVQARRDFDPAKMDENCKLITQPRIASPVNAVFREEWLTQAADRDDFAMRAVRPGKLGDARLAAVLE
ncbi:MAG: N-acetylmuramoyl-L-alanine amidase [Verrucomicrobia bacterium]|nr:N-acetylmuramoyl-L-alanine amidase [Verrucomicrobiota bacterium]